MSSSTRDTSMKDATPFMGYVDNTVPPAPADHELDQLLFPIDLQDNAGHFGFSSDWNASLFPPMHPPTLPPTDSNFASAIDPGSSSLYAAFQQDDDYFSRYTNQDSSPEFMSPSLSSPIQIPSSPQSAHTDSLSPGFMEFKDPHFYSFSSPSLHGLTIEHSPSAEVVFPEHSSTLAPGDLLLRHPAAHAGDPMASASHTMHHQTQYEQSLPQQQSSPPSWALQLWDIPRTSPVAMTAPRYTQPVTQPSTLDISTLSGFLGEQPQTYAAPHDRSFSFAAPRDLTAPRSNSSMFQPASAPSRTSTIRPIRSTRAYSQRAASETEAGLIGGISAGFGKADPDATVREKKKKRLSSNFDAQGSDSIPDSPRSSVDKGSDNPQKSELPKPPKLAPSTWQLFFTDWIQRHQMSGDRKLNVAQAAREAGAAYASLSAEQKEPYKRRSQAAKEARERELTAWQRTLKPEDIKRENAFRAAQRRAGKSRKGNIKDPNAPKKPLSAYFMFLQHIRADQRLVDEVFGDQKETTAQSVLAAKKWREMTDDERKPFLAQAEKEKLEYEAARRQYEDGPPGIESTISFSLPSDTFQSSSSGGTTFVIGHPQSSFGGTPSSLPGRGRTPESEMDSEGFATDETNSRRWSRRRF